MPPPRFLPLPLSLPRSPSLPLTRLAVAGLSALLALLPGQARADAQDDAATALFTAAFSGSCQAGFQEGGALTEPPQRFEITLASSHGAPEPAVLWQFFCDAGAYNMVSVFLLWTEFDGLRPLALPQPVLKVVNEDPENFESAVKEIIVTGWTAGFRAINAGFDPAQGTLFAASRWRGLGDAYDAATYVLRDGGAQLATFEADGSYDEESKPQLVLSFPVTGP